MIADNSADPEWVALDLFSQAEHDVAAQSILVSPDDGVIARVVDAMERLIAEQPRREIIEQALAQRGLAVRAQDLSEAVAIANRVAPEHLELMVAKPDDCLAEVRHAGAIFVGGYSAEVMGDYVAGPSHVLPTYGTARFSSPLSVYDFRKRSSVIRLSAEGAKSLAGTARTLAEGEGLAAHARSAELRQ